MMHQVVSLFSYARISYINNKYVKRFFVGRRHERGADIVRVYERLVRRDALRLASQHNSATYLARWQSLLHCRSLDRHNSCRYSQHVGFWHWYRRRKFRI